MHKLNSVLRIRIPDPVFLTPGSEIEKKTRSGMEKNPDPGSGIRDEILELIFENLVSVFWVKIT